MNSNLNQSNQAISMDSIQAAPSDLSCCDMEETTEFIDEGEAVKVTKATRDEPSKFVYPDNTINDFLAKPFLVKQGNWTTSQTFSVGTLFALSISNTLLANSYWTNKLQGYNLMRAKCVVRLVINANPFQQGKLLMYFSPLANSFSANDNGFGPRQTATLQGARQLPCVELDCRDTVGILEIPYIAPNNWFNIKTNTYDWGSLYCSVLSQLAMTGTTDTTVDYALYMHFEDLELAAPLVPQMAKPKVKGKNLTEEEHAKYQKTSISGTLATVSSVASSLSAVPVLSAVMGPAAWATGVMSGVASAFGWSKPLSEDAPVIVSRQYNRNMATSDGIDTSYPLAISGSNKVQVTDRLALYDCDEMSTAFLYGVSTFWTNFSWSGTVPSGDSGSSLLFSKKMDPTAIFGTGTFTTGTHVVTFHQGPPIYYLSNVFKLWRGSLEVTLKFAKTQYHSGRLQITWTPNGGAGTNVPTRANSLLALREIVDVRTQSEITLQLPYMCDSNYLPTGTSSGRLDILVLNELRAPDSVYNAIDVLVYVRGGADFELAVPSVVTYHPYSPQMDSTSLTQLVSKPIGKSTVPTISCQEALESVGEKFTSIKQLLSRHVPVYFNNLSARPSDSVGINPYFMSIPSLSNAGLMQQGDLAYGPLNFFAFMYLFHRGSMIIGIQKDPSVTGPNTQMVLAITTDTPSSVPQCITTGFPTLSNASLNTTQSFTDPSFPAGGFCVTDNNMSYVSAKVPFYCQQKTSVVTNVIAGNSATDPSFPLGRLQIYSPGNLTNGTYFRAAGDDYQLSYFLGAPPVYVSNT
jgi:hypothetical protein